MKKIGLLLLITIIILSSFIGCGSSAIDCKTAIQQATELMNGATSNGSWTVKEDENSTEEIKSFTIYYEGHDVGLSLLYKDHYLMTSTMFDDSLSSEKKTNKVGIWGIWCTDILHSMFPKKSLEECNTIVSGAKEALNEQTNYKTSLGKYDISFSHSGTAGIIDIYVMEISNF